MACTGNTIVPLFSAFHLQQGIDKKLFQVFLCKIATAVMLGHEPSIVLRLAIVPYFDNAQNIF